MVLPENTNSAVRAIYIVSTARGSRRVAVPEKASDVILLVHSHLVFVLEAAFSEFKLVVETIRAMSDTIREASAEKATSTRCVCICARRSCALAVDVRAPVCTCVCALLACCVVAGGATCHEKARVVSQEHKCVCGVPNAHAPPRCSERASAPYSAARAVCIHVGVVHIANQVPSLLISTRAKSD